MLWGFTIWFSAREPTLHLTDLLHWPSNLRAFHRSLDLSTDFVSLLSKKKSLFFRNEILQIIPSCYYISLWMKPSRKNKFLTKPAFNSFVLKKQWVFSFSAANANGNHFSKITLICTSNHMFGRVIWDKLPECIFGNFEIAQVKRGQFQNFQESWGWFIPKIAQTKHVITV